MKLKHIYLLLILYVITWLLLEILTALNIISGTYYTMMMMLVLLIFFFIYFDERLKQLEEKKNENKRKIK